MGRGWVGNGNHLDATKETIRKFVIEVSGCDVSVILAIMEWKHRWQPKALLLATVQKVGMKKSTLGIT